MSGIFSWETAHFGMKFSPGPWKGNYVFSKMPKDATIMINHSISRGGRDCTECHSPTGIMDWKGLGYTDDEIKRLQTILG